MPQMQMPPCHPHQPLSDTPETLQVFWVFQIPSRFHMGCNSSHVKLSFASHVEKNPKMLSETQLLTNKVTLPVTTKSSPY